MVPNQAKIRIRSSTYDSYILDQEHICLTSSLRKRKAQDVPKDVTIVNTVKNTLKTNSIGSISFGDKSFDISNGKVQVSSEIVPSPEQISSITCCSDGDAYSDSGFVDGGPFFHDSNMRLASKKSRQNYVQQPHFIEGNMNLTNRGSISDINNTTFPSFVCKSSELPSLDSHILLKYSLGMPRDLDISPSAYMNIPKTPCEVFFKSQLKMAGSRENNFFDNIQDSDYFSLEDSNAFDPTISSQISSILFGAKDASKLVYLNEKTLHEDLISYRNFKKLHNDGNEFSFMQYMHTSVCSEWTCHCSRFVLVAHFENCHLLECNICEPVRRLFDKGRIQENKFLDRKLNFSGNIPVHDGPPSGKRFKIDSFAPFEAPSIVNQVCVPKTPFFPVLDTSSFQNSSHQVSTGDDVALRGENKVIESIRPSDSCHMSLPSGEIFVDEQENEGEGRVKYDQAEVDLQSDVALVEADAGIEGSKPKLMGVSLIDFLSEKEVKEHLSSLSSSVGQELEEKLAASIGENTCQLCYMEKLLFAVAPVYCSCCGALIKPPLLYYSAIDEMGTRHSFCSLCFKASRGGEISFYGISISKQKMEKQKKHHVDFEPWVQCDNCKGWQHQICALYNDKRDLGENSDYVCPKCYLMGMKVGDYTPLPKTGAFEAKDLPTTKLSDHIEKRLFRRLKEEREERAKALQMNYDEVSGASDLVVRVVLSVSKLLNVKQQFLDIIPDEKYPTEFPFKSKVIFLFQKIDGVDVCLFGFYVQEFGSECGHPNQRSVYISYLDSVKYLRPEVKTSSGEALRTMIYHEILIGYLDYCKKQGFATCYIWACPPMKGEDYILYCHPIAQKKPKSDKLRNWYKSMLRKAAEEEISVDCTNLHDHFFAPNGGHNSKITLARLPYFDGDYWSVAAMDIIRKAGHGSDVDSQIKAKKILTKRTLKSMGHSNIPGDVAKDILVMQKLGQTISPLKEDFIMIRLQYTCVSCYDVILSGKNHWYCDHCKKFHLCSRCYGNVGSTHTSHSGERHTLSQAKVNDVPVDTDDRDVILDNGYLEYRHSFLGFCQGNHSQFDTLRRAKHSSMMILYHLHNSTVKSVETSCRLCGNRMLVKQGWNCPTCPDFNACDECYKKIGDKCHVHKLSRSISLGNPGLRNGQVLPHEELRLRGVMEGLLMHASQCIEIKIDTCPYPKCSTIKKLWRHAHQCNIRVSGGCQLCQKTWTLIRMHSENCKDSGCRVPRCLDIKKHMEMLKLQSDARQSAAVLGSVRGKSYP